MLDWIKLNSKSFITAVVFHLIFLSLLLFNWEMDKPKHIVLEQGDVIQVSSVDANSYDAEIKKIKQKKHQDERLKEQRKQQQIKKKQQEKKRRSEAKKKKQREAAALKDKQLKEKQHQEDVAKQKAIAKKKAEAKKVADAKKAADAKKVAEAKKAAEAKKIAAAKKKAKQEKAIQEAKRKAEAEKKRQAELQRQQKREREQWLQKSKGIVNRHAAMISRKIEQNWRQPLDVGSNLSCRVNIKLQPSGKVISVRVLESSGSLSFDRSVETAVRKASPLPVPENRELFEQFRDLTLSFEPGKN